MKPFVENCKNAFSDDEHPDLGSSQGVVPLVLIIAGFAVVSILVVTWIGNSIAWRAHLEARCISEQEGFSILDGTPDNKCIGADADYRGDDIIANQINNTKGGRF